MVAPDDGIVTRVDDLQVGDFVNPGAAVFSMMSSRPLFSGISVTVRVDTGYRRTWRHPFQAVPAAEAAK